MAYFDQCISVYVYVQYQQTNGLKIIRGLEAWYILGLPIVTSTIEKPRHQTRILRLFEAEGGKNEKFRGYLRVREQVIY